MKFKKLFETIQIGKVALKNRIVMAPMGVVGLIDRTGGFTQEAIDYYVERAFGGVGLIITGGTKVTNFEPLPTAFPSMENFRSFAELAESVQHFGTKIFVQLTAGNGRTLFTSWAGGVKPISASEIPSLWNPNVTTRALTIAEIEETVKASGNAAKLLKDAGIDGIELHGHAGYLLDQFATPIWNKRTDKYGGNLENRLRFAVEILNEIKDKAGADFPVVYRYGLKHYMKAPGAGALMDENFVEAGRDIDEGLQIARLMENAGCDALHVDAGCYDSWYWFHPPNYLPHGCMVNLTEKVKGIVKIPVIAVGRLDIPELAEQVLKDKKADMIALGRALLADPHWPKKVWENRVAEIRPCLACKDGCGTRMYKHKSISCSVNAAAGRERLYSLQRVEKATRVLVVGGGLAGMEAARVSATRGCQVTLLEKSANLGGHLIAASVPDFKQDTRRLLDWYKDQLKRLGVEIRFKVMATHALIEKEKPDRVIVATGSTPIIPDIPGIDKPIVATCIDLLLGRRKAGKSVVVIGGGLVGCETALWLANQGKTVTVIEALANLASGMFEGNRAMLLDLLRQRKVRLITSTRLDEVTDDGVRVIDGDSKTRTILCDTVALAVGLKPDRALYDSLKTEGIELYLIGDCQEPRKIRHAIWDGYYIASR